jgi:DNA-binding NtrC family response regulator
MVESRHGCRKERLARARADGAWTEVSVAGSDARLDGAVTETRFELVVVGGAGAGLRLPIGDEVQVVGRAMDAALSLADRRVSRHHLHVSASAHGVSIRVLDGAAKVLRNGEPTTQCEAVPGDEVVVGETVLAVALAPQRETIELGSADGTDVRTLLTGVAADVRGLASVFALGEALAGARDREAVAEVLRAWGKQHVSSVGLELAFESEPDLAPSIRRALAQPDRIVVERAERSEGDARPAEGCLAIVPACANPLCALAFRFDFPPERLGVSARRALVVAGGICALVLGRLHAVQALELDRDALRGQALGTAREFSGGSPAAQRLAKLLPRLAASDTCVLLLGETGSGKSFVARLLHEASARTREPFRVLNCAAIPENLVESELFGSERGAFTGSVAARAGAFEAAGSGTILLDEVGDLPLSSQGKLLQVLEERRFQRIGSTRELPVRARVLAATNRDLAAMVQAGTFRADLFYRLSVVTVSVPALRERPEDLSALAQQVLSDLAPMAGRRVRGFTPAALEAILRYPWPGNVRELRNAIERALVLGESERIEAEDLPELVTASAATGAVDPGDRALVRLPANLAWLEERAIEAALATTHGNRTQAAALLGIHRMTLVKKLRGERERARDEDDKREGNKED